MGADYDGDLASVVLRLQLFFVTMTRFASEIRLVTRRIAIVLSKYERGRVLPNPDRLKRQKFAYAIELKCKS